MKTEVDESYIVKKMFDSSVGVTILSVLTATIGMLVDGIVIGNCLGVEATATYGIVSPVFIILAAIGSIFSSGARTLCVKAIGKGDLKKSNEIFSISCVALVVVSCILILIFGVLDDPILVLFGAKGSSAALLPMAKAYLYGLLIGVPAILFTQMISSFMRLIGKQNLSLVSVVIMTIVNVAGDLMNAFVFKGGMFGMALATTLSYYVSLLVTILPFFAKDCLFKISLKGMILKDLKDVFFLGLPTAISRACSTLRTVSLNNILLIIASSSAVAALSVQNTLNQFFGSIGMGIGMTTLMVCGIVAGEEDKTSLKHLLVIALKRAIIMTGIVAILMFVFAPFLVSHIVKGESDAISMGIKSVRFFALSMPLYSISIVFMNFFQGSGNLVMAHTICIFDNFVYVVLAAVILGFTIGTDGVWCAFLIGEVLLLITLFTIAAVRKKGIPSSVEDFMFLPKNFGVPDEDRMEASVQTMDQVIEASKQTEAFCKTHGADARKTMLLPLCVEEMLGNIIEYGFTDGKKHSVDLRILKKEEEWIIRVRDDCRAFDPKQQLELHNPEDVTSNIGIRMVYGMAKDVNYVNSMQLNNLIIKI